MSTAWPDSTARMLIDATIDPSLERLSEGRAAVLIDPVLAACARLDPPLQHIVPLLAAARLLNGLARLCNDDPAFITAAFRLAALRRREGVLTVLDILASDQP